MRPGTERTIRIPSESGECGWCRKRVASCTIRYCPIRRVDICVHCCQAEGCVYLKRENKPWGLSGWGCGYREKTPLEMEEDLAYRFEERD